MISVEGLLHMYVAGLAFVGFSFNYPYVTKPFV